MSTDWERPTAEDVDDWMLLDSPEAPGFDAECQVSVVECPSPIVEFELAIVLCSFVLVSGLRLPEPDIEMDGLRVAMGCEVSDTDTTLLVNPCFDGPVLPLKEWCERVLLSYAVAW